MTRLQRLQRLNLILVVLAVAFGAVLLLREPLSAKIDKDSWQAQFPAFDVEFARRIVIEQAGGEDGPGGDSIALARTSDGTWVVASRDGYPARSEAVEALLQGIGELRVRKLITTRPETFGKYAAHDGFTEITVFGAGSEELAAFALGRDTDRYPEVFTRVGAGDDSKIVQTTGVTRSMAATRLTSWVEPRLWPGVRHELMLRMDVAQGDDRLIVARRGEAPSDIEVDTPEAEDGKVWWIVEPAPPSEPKDESRVENLGRFFTGLRLEGVAGKAEGDDARAELGVEPVRSTVTFWQAGAEQIERLTLEIGQPTADGRRVRVMKSGSPWVYEVPTYAVGDYLAPPASFKPDPDPEPETPDDADDADDGDEEGNGDEKEDGEGDGG